MPNAECATDGADAQGPFEIAQLAAGTANGKLGIAAIHCQPRRVVAAIFKLLQTFEDNWNGLVLSDVPDDPAHF
jgi:hypothetical protein